MTTGLTALPGMRPRLFRTNLRSLPPPPNWSIHDWNIELDQVAAIAAWEATNDFDPTFHVPLDAFIHQRVRHRILTIYRRECGFGFRQVSASPEELENLSMVESQTVPTIDEQQFKRDEAKLVKALQLLYPACSDIIIALFQQRASEAEIASALNVSQQAISKRKASILKCLRVLIWSDCQATVACSGKCWKKFEKNRASRL